MTETSRSDVPVDVVIPAGQAVGTWAMAWVAGPVLLASIVLAVVNGGTDDPSIAAIVAASAAGWLVFLVALRWVSARAGTGDVRRDLAVAFHPRDLLAVPAGALAQLAILPVVYAPLRAIWPDTFSRADIEQRAQELVDRAGGFDTVLLAVLVVIGAPVVEELVYRGLLQRSVGRTIGRVGALVAVSLLFALIHVSPVEIPGLFVAGLVFGGCVVLTGRLGPAILAHAAFNATGLVLLLN